MNNEICLCWHMNKELIELLRKIEKDLVFFEICSKFSEEVEKSMKRSFWYLRPSHTELMRNWKMVINMWEKSK